MQRDVFYIAGYDPKSYRFYYDLFKKNLATYNTYFDKNFTLTKCSYEEEFPFWRFSGEQLEGKYTFLSWNEIVKKNWSDSYFDALKDCYSFFRIYTITGLFIKFGKESIYQLITGFYPFFYVLFSLFISLFFAAGIFVFLQDYVHVFLAFVMAILPAFLVNRYLFKLGKKLAVFWISRICAFCARWDKNKSLDLDTKINHFVKIIKQTLENNAYKKDYELILIAHSVGTIVCIEVLECLLKQLDNEKLQKLKILTLGECIPLVSYQKDAYAFREKLEFISHFKLKWYDYTSIIDGACFPQVDFFSTSGVKALFKPRFYSAKFHTLYEKEHYRKIKRDKQKAHFLYLYSPQIKGEYNFFDFILGQKFLEEKIN